LTESRKLGRSMLRPTKSSKRQRTKNGCHSRRARLRSAVH